jgi:NADPH:quinone reductase-like Zn-dependent oxidoreductase
VGLYAVQLAKRAGARVTAVSGPDGVDLLQELGAEVVVNYRERPVLEALRGQTFRGLLELSGKLGFDDAGALLEPGGIYVDFSPSPASLIGNTLANPFRSRQHRFAFTATRRAALDEVGRLLERGELKAAPTEVLPFEQARAVVERSERGSVVGKLVLRWG